VIDQLRGVRFPEALVVVAIGAMAVGVAVTADALVEAARATPGTEAMDWTDRLLLGLWSFRLEHTLWFTAGVVLLWWTVVRERPLPVRAADAARLAGGLATGYMLLAAAVILGATVVAGSGSVGSGAAEVTFDGRERLLTWLLQLSTGAAAGAVWALAAVSLGDPRRTTAGAGEDGVSPAPEQDREPWDAAREPRAEPEPQLTELDDEPPPPPPPVPLRPKPASEPAEAPRAAPATAYGRARRVFEERLAFSPRRDDAKQLLDQIARAEDEGRPDEAGRLADRLADM
jgi:hypothetical protein